MTIRTLFIVLILASCQKEQKTAPAASVVETSTVASTKEETKEKALKTDTIAISDLKNAEVTHVLANLMHQKVDKDSIVVSRYRLDFYQKKNKVASSEVTIKNYEKGSEWYGSTGLKNTSDKNSSFIQIDFGYAACGYTHENYLYYIKNGNLQLVHNWQSMSDSGWGSWTEFTTNETQKDPDHFYCKIVGFEPSDDDSEDSGILTYSDSTSFSLNGNQWQKKLLSAKDKPYFEKKMSFNEFHKQE